MTDTQTAAGASWPTARADRQTILAQFGEARTDLLQQALVTGDPLADAVVTEMHDLGMKRARPLLDQGLRQGLASLDDPPPALAALLTDAERAPSYVDDAFYDELPLPYFSAPDAVHIISLSAGALVRVYSSPSIAEVLMASGRLVEGAQRRLVETGRWLTTTMLPGSLRPGAAGYVGTLQVRMLHAHMRRHALNRGYDAEAFGAPINQVDLARTWMDFTLTSYRAEEALGFGTSSLETAGLYRYWWLIAHLLGIEPTVVHGVVDHQGAQRLDDLFQAVTGPLADDSALLADTTLTSISGIVQDFFKIPPRLSRPVLDSITHRIHGPAICQDLGVQPSPAADAALAPAISAIRRRRSRQRAHPTAWSEQISRNLASVREGLVEQADAAAYERGATGAHD